MNKKQKNIQLTLALIGFLLIIGTYFYYPMINKNKTTENQSAMNQVGMGIPPGPGAAPQRPAFENLDEITRNFGTPEMIDDFAVEVYDAYEWWDNDQITILFNIWVLARDFNSYLSP